MKFKIALAVLAFSAASFANAAKVCEFNDPITGTTPGCTQQSVGGSQYGTYYWIKKDGVGLMSVAKEYPYWWGGCVLSGTPQGGHTVSGNCDNFRIYKD